VYYFKAPIPVNTDGSRATYSPTWHGVMDRCPRDVTVLLYNDKAGYLVAKSEDTFVPKEVEVIDDKTAQALASESMDKLEAGSEQVYFDKTLLPEGYEWIANDIESRWLPKTELIDWQPCLEMDEKLRDSEVTAYIPDKSTVKSQLAYCPICHKLSAFVTKKADGSVSVIQNGQTLINGIRCKNIVVACPAGHKVKVCCG